MAAVLTIVVKLRSGTCVHWLLGFKVCLTAPFVVKPLQSLCSSHQEAKRVRLRVSRLRQWLVILNGVIVCSI
jgi:hypothetical protein